MATDFGLELSKRGRAAREAARRLASLSPPQKNRCLEAIGTALTANCDRILEANALDVADAEASGLSAPRLDRLRLTPERLENAALGVQALVGLPDPVRQVASTWLRPNGLKIEKVRIPIGVIAMIYESSPTLTIDAAAVCLKAGNAVILRGGSEALRSNSVLTNIMVTGGTAAGLPDSAIQLLPWPDRQAVVELLRMNEYVDLAIPRGGEGLTQMVNEQATVPVVKHSRGVCHIYVDKDADQDMALDIIENAKCQRPAVGNAVETVLLHEEIAQDFAPRLAGVLARRKVQLRGDEAFCALIPAAAAATEADWHAEYLKPVLAVRIVDSFKKAVDHIATYGSGHSDAIITSNRKTAMRFTDIVDSAVVYVNASTRFTDGVQFGMGAEIGISTDRIHARGPIGVEELTTYKYVAHGTGQVR